MISENLDLIYWDWDPCAELPIIGIFDRGDMHELSTRSWSMGPVANLYLPNGGTNTITPSFVYNWPIKHHEDTSDVFYNYCRSRRNDYDYPPLFSCTLNSKPQLDERVCSAERRGISVELMCVWMFWSIHDMLGLWYAAVWRLLLLCGWAGWWVGPLLRTRVRLMPIAVHENNYWFERSHDFSEVSWLWSLERVKVTIGFR
jgi:hypothetical protein